MTRKTTKSKSDLQSLAATFTSELHGLLVAEPLENWLNSEPQFLQLWDRIITHTFLPGLLWRLNLLIYIKWYIKGLK